MTDETKTETMKAKERVSQLLNEALSGLSGKSKNTLIKEALKALEDVK